MEHRSHKGTVELREIGGIPVIAGYAAVFNSDSADMGFIEQIDPAAFNRTVNVADVRALGNHDVNWLLGRSKSSTLRLFVDSVGLGYEVNVNPADPDGVRAIEKVRRGDWDGSSFSFQTIRDQWNWEATPPQRRLLEVALIDVGPVTYPAYPDATAAMRSALEPIAKRCGRDVTDLIDAMASGEIRSLIDGRKEPEVESRALTVAWGPEDGFQDLLVDCEEQLNDGAIGYGWRYAVTDAAIALDKVLIYDCTESQFWVAAITVDDTNEPTVAQPADWTSVESGWIATMPDEMGGRLLAQLAERRTGAKLSQASKDLIHAAMKSLRDLLGVAEDSDVLGDEQNAARIRELELRGLELAA